MSTPKTDYKNPFSGARNEIGGAVSSLHMNPEPIVPEYPDDTYLVYVDAWAKHANEHIKAATKCLELADKKH